MTYFQTTNLAIDQQRHHKISVWVPVRGFIRRLITRHNARNELGQLSEQLTKDLGLTQSDVQLISALPRSVDVATELSIRANGHRKNR